MLRDSALKLSSWRAGQWNQDFEAVFMEVSFVGLPV
jgi:hypothetical protein